MMNQKMKILIAYDGSSHADAAIDDLRRAGLPQDVAGTVLFLASDDCRYMTGQTLLVDGGLSITI